MKKTIIKILKETTIYVAYIVILGYIYSTGGEKALATITGIVLLLFFLCIIYVTPISKKEKTITNTR